MGWGVSFSALGLLLCLSSPARGRQDEAQDAKFSVSISGERVTLSCPPESLWKDTATPALTVEAEEEGVVEKKGSCKAGQEFVGDIYLKARVCADCVELSVGLVAGLVLSDLLVTLGILLLVYFCGKKHRARCGGGPVGRSPPGQPQGPKADRPPPVPNPDYEPIRKGQREVYAGLEPRAF